MPTTFHLRVWTRYFDSLDKVWAVKTDPDLLEKEFPCGFAFKVDDPDALSHCIQNGGSVQTSGTLGVARIAWPISLESIEPGKRFKDTSSNALFSRFEHEHIFEETSDGTRYIDSVTFTPKTPAPKFAAILTKNLFVKRHKRAASHLNADERTIGAHVLRVMVEEEPPEEDG